MRAQLLIALAGALLAACPAIAEPAIDGLWLSGDGDGWIEIRSDGDDLTGSIAGSPNDDKPRYDDKNPDPELRSRPLMGMVIMSNFTRAGPGKWKAGRIYDPNSGKTYRCNITLVDANTLKLRGYIGISLLGRTDTWTRRQD